MCQSFWNDDSSYFLVLLKLVFLMYLNWIVRSRVSWFLRQHALAAGWHKRGGHHPWTIQLYFNITHLQAIEPDFYIVRIRWKRGGQALKQSAEWDAACMSRVISRNSSQAVFRCCCVICPPTFSSSLPTWQNKVYTNSNCTGCTPHVVVSLELWFQYTVHSYQL